MKGVIFAFLYVSQLIWKAHLVVFLLRLERWSSLPASGFLWGHRPLQVSDLLDQIILLVAELLVLWPVSLELAQELHQFGLVLQQYVQYGLGFVWVCNKNLREGKEMLLWTEKGTGAVWGTCKRTLLYLEDVEGFKLDVPAVVSQQVHHQLQVLWFTDVFGHDSKIVPVQKKFPKELKTDRRTETQTSQPCLLSRHSSSDLERSLTFKDCRFVT